MSLDVPHELRQFVNEEVASGKYRSEEEVVSAGLRLLQERERQREALLADLQVGIDQLAEGKGITVANESEHRQFFQEIEKRGHERRAAKGTTV